MVERWHILKVADQFGWIAASAFTSTEARNEAQKKRLKKIAKALEEKQVRRAPFQQTTRLGVDLRAASGTKALKKPELLP